MTVMARYSGVCPDWDQPGILAAIKAARMLGTPQEIGVALCRLANNYELRTPAMLHQPGAHWHGTGVAERARPNQCAQHPEHPSGRCPDCDRESSEPPPEFFAAKAALPRTARRDHGNPTPKTAPSLATTRARADQQ